MIVCIDVESDGPSPANGSMVCFGAVLVSDMTQTFYGQTKPITDVYNPEALSVSGFSREEHLGFDDPKEVMVKFTEWLNEISDGSRPIFISDNNGFDWQWINYYFWKYTNGNPFGYSSRRIGDLYCGMVHDASKNSEWKRKFRKTKHTHSPIQDCLGNVESLLMMKKNGLKIRL